MNIAWATDIHLNFISERQALLFCREIINANAEVLLIGGDIAESHSLIHWLQFLDQHLPTPIYFVLGNHDYYGSSIAAVRQQVIAAQSKRLRWLPDAGVIKLTPDRALVGHDGWADARYGNFMRSPVMPNDYLQIDDLVKVRAAGKSVLKHKLSELGDQAAAELKPHLQQALAHYSQVIVLTHIPPLREACWHEGEISNDDWLPGFTCRAIGELLLDLVSQYPECDVTVLCGHTYGEGITKPLPNLKVITGGAEYGAPTFRMI